MLIPVKYHKRSYPAHIKPGIDEVAGHFDLSKISAPRAFSLHTEYSYGKRSMLSALLGQFPVIRKSHNQGVPKLWHSNEWAIEFAHFIKFVCNGAKPAIIEIHPPFSDYTESIEAFLNRYKKFEELVLDFFPDSKIFIENRSGSIYKGGKFILSRGRDLRELSEGIARMGLKLRITLDIPQLITAYGGPQSFDSSLISCLLNRQKILQPMVDGIHLWGKKKSASGRTVSHSGDWNTYFESDREKKVFLEWLASFLEDNKIRYFVPEVKGNTYRLVVVINYQYQIIYIRFIGTHQAYNNIDATKI